MRRELVVTSVGGLFPHTHTLRVPADAVADPPSDGVVLATSEEYSLVFKHAHRVRLTRDELARVRAGEEVVVFDTDKRRHRFTFAAGLYTAE